MTNEAIKISPNHFFELLIPAYLLVIKIVTTLLHKSLTESERVILYNAIRYFKQQKESPLDGTTVQAETPGIKAGLIENKVDRPVAPTLIGFCLFYLEDRKLQKISQPLRLL
jgi:hypothetical protein